MKTYVILSIFVNAGQESEIVDEFGVHRPNGVARVDHILPTFGQQPLWNRPTLLVWNRQTNND